MKLTKGLGDPIPQQGVAGPNPAFSTTRVTCGHSFLSLTLREPGCAGAQPVTRAAIEIAALLRVPSPAPPPTTESGRPN